MVDLDAAAEAHRAALAELDTAKAKVRSLRDRVTETRAELAAAIEAETLAGTRQNEIVRRTGYSREQVRTILRARGIEP